MKNYAVGLKLYSLSNSRGGVSLLPQGGLRDGGLGLARGQDGGKGGRGVRRVGRVKLCPPPLSEH